MSYTRLVLYLVSIYDEKSLVKFLSWRPFEIIIHPIKHNRGTTIQPSFPPGINTFYFGTHRTEVTKLLKLWVSTFFFWISRVNTWKAGVYYLKVYFHNIIILLDFVKSKLRLRYNNLAGGCDIVQELNNWMSECNNLTNRCVLVQELDNLVFWCINLAKHLLGDLFFTISICHYIAILWILPYNIEFNL